MTQEAKLTFREDILGVEQPVGDVEITEELIRGYSKALGEATPGWTGETQSLEAPIGLLNLFFTRAAPQEAEVKLEGATVTLNAGRAIETYKPIRAGDVLTRTAKLKEVYAKTGRSGTMAFEVWEIIFRNAQGETVAVARDSRVFRPAGGRSGDGD